MARGDEKLARSDRTVDLTSVWVPDEGSEAWHDLVRRGQAAKQDQLRTRHRLSKFLLRMGCRFEARIMAWTALYIIGDQIQDFMRVPKSGDMDNGT